MRKTIKDYPKYEADDNGTIYNKRTGRALKVRIHHCCPEVQLYNDSGKAKHCVPSRLVLSTFRNIEGSEALDIHYLDMNQYNNNLDNLIWVTRKQHRRLHRLMKNQIQQDLQIGNYGASK